MNNGAWPGHGQLMDEDYVKKGRTFVYPDMQDAWGGPYGYTLWLWAQYEDPVSHLLESLAVLRASLSSFLAPSRARVLSSGAPARLSDLGGVVGHAWVRVWLSHTHGQPDGWLGAGCLSMPLQ